MARGTLDAMLRRRLVSRRPSARRRSRDASPSVDLEALPRSVPADQVENAVRRVRQLTSRPLTAVGAGMTAIVLCDDQGRAYKAARRPHATTAIEDEAEWLRTANQVPGLKERVARFIHYDRERDILVRSCPQPVESAYRRRGKLHDLWKQIAARMQPYGWGPPEYKEDSFVITRSGPVLVDAGFALRLGRRQLAYVQDILAGRRKKPPNERWSDLAFTLRQDVSDKRLRPEHVRPTIQRLAQLDPEAGEWMV